MYAVDVPLSKARDIVGVRAVFGETYPDPVRVVSIGVPVEELLEDPNRPEWRSVSVEFCGGTHVKFTTEIKDLVVLEESGIAKGIRRIVAVRGATAHEVQQLAKEWEHKVAELESMQYSGAKEALTKETQHGLGQLEISAIIKTQLRERIAKVVKLNLEQQKGAQKAESKAVLDAVAEYFEQHKENKTAVLSLSVSEGSKAVQEAIKVISSKQKDKTVYLLGKADDRVMHGCFVSEAAQGKGADASKWATEVAGVVGGKAGGKGATSLGQGTSPDKVDEGVEVARKYLESLGL